MNFLINFFITLYFYEYFIIVTIIDSFLSFPLFILSPSGKLFHKALMLTAKFLLFISGSKIILLNKNKYNTNKESFIVISNHQSLFDILILYVTFNKLSFKWVIKKSLFNIPLFGFPILYLARYIKLNRKNKYKAYKSIQTSVAWLKKGFSMIIFPEGTRSLTDEIHTFKSGSIKLAFLSQKPILPIVMRGTLFIKSKKNFLINPTAVYVKILNKIDVKKFEPSQQKGLLSQINMQMQEKYNSLPKA